MQFKMPESTHRFAKTRPTFIAALVSIILNNDYGLKFKLLPVQLSTNSRFAGRSSQYNPILVMNQQSFGGIFRRLKHNPKSQAKYFNKEPTCTRSCVVPDPSQIHIPLEFALN
jgi:hypothetical protein